MSREVVATTAAALALVALTGCGEPAATPPGPGAGPVPVAEVTVSMVGFSWIDAHHVAGMPRPGVRRPLAQDLDWLAGQGVDLLVSLTEDPIDPAALAARGMAALHLPVRDFHAPSLAQLEAYVAAVESWNAAGGRVGTHCGAGMGRTGTFLAALLVARGADADAAIAEIRRLRPGSIETRAQEEAVRELARAYGRGP